MKTKDLEATRKKDVAELEKLIQDKKIDLAKSYMVVKTGKQKNNKESKNLKRDIAQLKTIVREKEIVEESKKESKKE